MSRGNVTSPAQLRRMEPLNSSFGRAISTDGQREYGHFWYAWRWLCEVILDASYKLVDLVFHFCSYDAEPPQ